jgi:hypothetical protein
MSLGALMHPNRKKFLINKFAPLAAFMSTCFASLSMADEACPPGTVRIKSDTATETCVSQRTANYIACLERVPRRTLHRDDGTNVDVNLSAAAQGQLRKILPVSASGDAKVTAELRDLLLKEFGGLKDASSEIEAIKGCTTIASGKEVQSKRPINSPKAPSHKTQPQTSNPTQSKPLPSPTDSGSATRNVRLEGGRYGDQTELSGGNCEGPKCDPVNVEVKDVECGTGCKLEFGNQKSH